MSDTYNSCLINNNTVYCDKIWLNELFQASNVSVMQISDYKDY